MTLVSFPDLPVITDQSLFNFVHHFDFSADRLIPALRVNVELATETIINGQLAQVDDLADTGVLVFFLIKVVNDRLGQGCEIFKIYPLFSQAFGKTHKRKRGEFVGGEGV